MLSSVYRCLIRLAEKLHDPKRPRALVLSRRAFARALALVAFGGIPRPASPRVVPSGVCECDGRGQCSGSCQPSEGPCAHYHPVLPGDPAGTNCWCEQPAPGVWAHVCDCYCPGAEWEYCTCRTLDFDGCDVVA